MAQRVVDQTITPEELEKMEADAKKKRNAAAKSVGEAEESTEIDSKSKKKGKKTRGKNYAKARGTIDKTKQYSIEEAIKSLKKNTYAKFDEAVELHVVLGIDTTKTDQRVRFLSNLPHGVGKESNILVLSDNNRGKDGNILWRDESAVDEIVSGKLKPDTDFNVVIATPAMMKNIAKAARILGPKGMMPSPKTGTVTDKPENAVKELAKGQIEIRSQAGHAVIQQSVGRIKFEDNQLKENIEFILEELQKNTPAKLKKKFIQKAYICSTMSPSLRVAI